MRVHHLRSWLGPLFAGALGTAWVAIAVASIFGPTDPLLGNRFWNWVVAMLICTPIVLALVLAIVVVDLVLVRLGQALPTGRRAWLSAAAAPLLVGGAYQLKPPGSIAMMAVPVLAIALVVRLVPRRSS